MYEPVDGWTASDHINSCMNPRIKKALDAFKKDWNGLVNDDLTLMFISAEGLFCGTKDDFSLQSVDEHFFTFGNQFPLYWDRKKQSFSSHKRYIPVVRNRPNRP